MSGFPKILELDVNRYLHEINTVIANASKNALKTTRSQGSVRSYNGTILNLYETIDYVSHETDVI